MFMIKYQRASGEIVKVIVGVKDIIEAQRLVKASDSEYVKMVDYIRADGEVWLLG